MSTTPRRLLAALGAVTALTTLMAGPSFATTASDTTAPNGTYTLNRTTVWLAKTADTGYVPPAVTITQKSLSDDVDPASSITRQYLWSGTTFSTYPSGTTVTKRFTTAQTLTPKVKLTDTSGNSRTIALPNVVVKKDLVPPTLTVTRPSTAPGKASSWSVIRGTITDAQTGPSYALVILTEKRGGYFYIYNDSSKKWFKAGTTDTSAMNSSNGWPSFATRVGNKWHTGTISGITTGTLFVHYFGADKGGNQTSTARIQQTIYRL